MTDDCVSNLDICHASCCRVLPFNIKSYPGDNLEDYYRKHGCGIKRLSREFITVLVPCICKNLDTETNLCMLHDKGTKPALCKSLNSTTCNSRKYYLTEGCIYKK